MCDFYEKKNNKIYSIFTTKYFFLTPMINSHNLQHQYDYMIKMTSNTFEVNFILFYFIIQITQILQAPKLL